ncbi:conserved Plasmodium protein, unknown function, partial [Plasmodium malariae]
MIKKILKNLSISNEERDETFSHSENILNLIEGIIIHENSYYKYVNILNELTTLCFEDPINFRKLLFAKNEKINEQKKKVHQIVDRLLIILEKYEDCRNTFIYAIAKLVFINDHHLNVRILRILCNIASNEEYKHDVYSVFEEIVATAILNTTEKGTLDNIFNGLYLLPRDIFIAGSFSSCIHRVIKLLRNSFNENILRFLSVSTLDSEVCLIAYDEGLLRILTELMNKHKDSRFDDLPIYFQDAYLIVLQLCSNCFKHCEILIREKMHINFYFKKIREIINKGSLIISKKESIYCNIIISTLNNICIFQNEILVELCNTHHFIDLLLIGIKMEKNNPYFLSASLGGLLIVLKNEEIYNNNIEYILNNTNNLKILLPFLFGQKYNNMLSSYTNSDHQVEGYLFEVVNCTLDIIAFFFQKEADKFSIKAKREFRNSDINYYLLVCL